MVLDEPYFLNHSDKTIANLAVDLVTFPYELSENWLKVHKIDVIAEDKLLRQAVVGTVNNFKMKKIIAMLDENFTLLRNSTSEEEKNQLLERLMELGKIKMLLSEALGIVVVR